MKDMEKILLIATLIVLLVPIASANDVSDDTTITADDAIEVADDADMISQTDTITQKQKLNEYVADETPNNKEEYANKSVDKKSTKENVKEETKIYTWDMLKGAVDNLRSATEDTTLELSGNLYNRENIHIIWNNPGMVLTIDGKGYKIDGCEGTYQRPFTVEKGCSLILKNITICNQNLTNFGSSEGAGASIKNMGNLTIIYSSLINNSAPRPGNGGAIHNTGDLNIINTTINNNDAYSGSGGAIFNEGNTNITNSTLNNNTALNIHSGGAIYHKKGSLKIINSTLNNNYGRNGGTIYLSSEASQLTLTGSNFTENTATEKGAVICCSNPSHYEITDNTFTRNTANNKETLDLYNARTVKDNTYNSTDISLKTMDLTVKDDKQSFNYGDNIILNFNIALSNPRYYDPDILEKLDKTIYINNQENITTKSKAYTLTDLEPGEYTLFFNSCNAKSNNLTFTVSATDSEITTDTSYDYYDGINSKITLEIRDISGEKGTADIYVKKDEGYAKVIRYSNVKDGYNISTKSLIDALEKLDPTLNSQYTINITYTSKSSSINPSSTEFALNVIKQRNTSIIYKILNNTESNVKINITVIDTVFKTPIPDAQIEVTGNITINTTSGIINDTTLKQGECRITVKFNENSDYKESETTIDFNVEIDKDKKIDQMEEEVNELNDILDELLKQYNTTITINPIQSSVGTPTTISANITDSEGRPVTEGKVVFKVNGVTLKDENKNVLYSQVTNGKAAISYKAQNIWTKNASYIEAVYSGSKKYITSRTNASDVLNISKGTATITLDEPTINAKSGQKITLRAIILDTNGDRITCDKAVFKLNGKSLTDKNGNVLYAKVVDGEATLDYTIPAIYSAKTYNLTVVYGGSYYERTEANGQVILEKKAVTINTDSITTVNKKTTIKATITDETGKLLVTSTKLAIKINGKTILKGVNSTNGIINVSFTTTLRPGTYEMEIISGENGIYKTGRTTTVLKIPN